MSALMEKSRDFTASKAEDRRRWSRIPVAIPVFVRGKDGEGKEFREFTTAFNIGGGGILLATRRYVPKSSTITLEIPAGPLSSQPMPQKYFRDLVGRAVTVTHTEQCYLCGVKFNRPLIQPSGKKSSSKKK
jgi:PilZ domain